MTEQITAPMSMAVAALDAMDNHAALVREVAVRLLSEHAAGLPELLAVRTHASQDGPRLFLQPRTHEDTELWAQALGVALTEEVVEYRSGWRQLHVSGEVIVDGVPVRLGSCQSLLSVACDDRAGRGLPETGGGR